MPKKSTSNLENELKRSESLDSFLKENSEELAVDSLPEQIQELLDAKAHPERHKDLMVRISGLSAYFVTLTDKVQDEIIARYSVNA